MTKFRLININSKLKALLIFLPLIIFLTSCQEQGCVEAQQFDDESIYVEAKPNGIQGGYNNITGGQVASWQKTNLMTNGKGIVAEISGEWRAWDADSNSGYCNICVKKNGVDNCICKDSEISKKYEDETNYKVTSKNCSAEDQKNSSMCTCTAQSGKMNDPGTYLITLDYQNKDETIKAPDYQDSCKFRGGAGLYIGLFGKTGNNQPIRIYQLFSSTEICDIPRDSNGECIDKTGKYLGKYLYVSPNNSIFIKDDKNGNKNDGSDTDSSNDESHIAGEYIKLIINDRYYDDNSGGYNIKFLAGVIKAQSGSNSGLLEYIVGSVEDAMLGKISADGKSRSGGILEFLYNSIVKNTAFILIVRLCLTMYIVLFGIWILSGRLQISQKEILQRLIKISLIIFFTTPTSWYWYNQIVVGFFKGGMDYLIAMIMDISDKNVSPTSLIITSQLDRAQALSNATRFSYVDVVIAKLFSGAVSKKIWGLFFGGGAFGFLYILIAYFLIFAFIYIMITAALVYISALMRLIFVLCLGPIFMITLLFNKTDEIYKRWLSFMGSQAVQIIALFLVIYLFLTMIDLQFNELFNFRVCNKALMLGFTSISVLESYPSRNIIGWFVIFFKISILLFLLKMVMEKIPGFAGQLVSIGGQKADNSLTFIGDTNNSAFGLAKSMMGDAVNGIKNYAIPGVVAPAINMVGKAASASIGVGLNKISEAIPFRSPTTMYRDYTIDNVIADKQKLGQENGHSGQKLDAFVRSETLKELGKQDPKNMFGLSNSIGGMISSLRGTNDQKAILGRLDEKLVKEPLANAISDSIKEVKAATEANKVPLDKKEMREAIREKVQNKMTKQGVAADSDRINKMLDEKGVFRSQIKKEGALTSSEAVQKFANDEKSKNRYLQHLEKEQHKKEEKEKNSWVKRGKNKFKFGNAHNPITARDSFLKENPNFSRKQFFMDYFKQDKTTRNKDDERIIRNAAFKFMDEENKATKDVKIQEQNKLNKAIIEASISDRDKGYEKITIEKSTQDSELNQLIIADKLANEPEDKLKANINLLKKEVETLPDPLSDEGKKDLINLSQNSTPEDLPTNKNDINDKLKDFYKGEQCAIKSKLIKLKTEQFNKENEKKKLNPIKDKSEIKKLDAELASLSDNISKEESDSKRIESQLNEIK